MHCWADLQSVHGFRCYDDIAPNAKCQRVLKLILDLCLVYCCIHCHNSATEKVRFLARRAGFANRLLRLLYSYNDQFKIYKRAQWSADANLRRKFRLLEFNLRFSEMSERLLRFV